MGAPGIGVIDHIFMLVDQGGQEVPYLESLGLVETYRRTHAGQGTRNVCYCFDNLFLELLWVDDAAAAQGEAIRRTGLYERSLWRTNGACPFGIAVRQGELGFRSIIAAVATWEFRPPYLSAGMSIAVATESDDLRQPMMFESPGSTAPVEWPVEKRGQLQHRAGLGAITKVVLSLPAGVAPSGVLKRIAREQKPELVIGGAGAYGLCLWVESVDDGPGMEIVLSR